MPRPDIDFATYSEQDLVNMALILLRNNYVLRLSCEDAGLYVVEGINTSESNIANRNYTIFCRVDDYEDDLNTTLTRNIDYEESARKDAEIDNLRAQVKSLQSQVDDLTTACTYWQKETQSLRDSRIEIPMPQAVPLPYKPSTTGQPVVVNTPHVVASGTAPILDTPAPAPAPQEQDGSFTQPFFPNWKVNYDNPISTNEVAPNEDGALPITDILPIGNPSTDYYITPEDVVPSYTDNYIAATEPTTEVPDYTPMHSAADVGANLENIFQALRTD